MAHKSEEIRLLHGSIKFLKFNFMLTDKANNLIMKFFSSWNLINFAIMKI